MTRLTSLLCLCASSLLAGCQTGPYVPTLYDAQGSDIRTVALSTSPDKRHLRTYEVENFSGVGAAVGIFVPFSGLSVAAMEHVETQGRNDRLAEVMAGSGFDARAVFNAELERKLEAGGITDVIPLDGLEDEAPRPDTDALMDIDFDTFGIGKVRTGQPWHPTAGIDVRMTLAGGGGEDPVTVMEHKIRYNSGEVSGADKGAIMIDLPAGTQGPLKITEIEPAVMEAQMRAMIDTLTDTIVQLAGVEATNP